MKNIRMANSASRASGCVKFSVCTFSTEMKYKITFFFPNQWGKGLKNQYRPLERYFLAFSKKKPFARDFLHQYLFCFAFLEQWLPSGSIRWRLFKDILQITSSFSFLCQNSNNHTPCLKLIRMPRCPAWLAGLHLATRLTVLWGQIFQSSSITKSLL